MLIRVLARGKDENTPLGTIESPEAPAIGDGFFWKTQGPFKVVDRIWSFPVGHGDKAEHLTLVVEEISKHKDYTLKNV